MPKDESSIENKCNLCGDIYSVYYSGIPGILASTKDGNIDYSTFFVERCSECEIYDSDAAAFVKLISLDKNNIETLFHATVDEVTCIDDLVNYEELIQLIRDVIDLGFLNGEAESGLNNVLAGIRHVNYLSKRLNRIRDLADEAERLGLLDE